MCDPGNTTSDDGMSSVKQSCRYQRISYVILLLLTLLIDTHTAVLWPFVRDYLGGPVPEETFTPETCSGIRHHSGFYEGWGR